MLVKLSMKNFKSFVDKTEIDLNATGYEILSKENKTNDNILKGAIFVGGNATGKTNVIRAIRFLLEFLNYHKTLIWINLFRVRNITKKKKQYIHSLPGFLK